MLREQVQWSLRLVIAGRILIRFELADDRPGVHWPRPDPSRRIDLPNVDICDRNDKRDLNHDRADRNRDQHDINKDKRDLRADRRDIRADKRDIHHDRRDIHNDKMGK